LLSLKSNTKRKLHALLMVVLRNTGFVG